MSKYGNRQAKFLLILTLME